MTKLIKGDVVLMRGHVTYVDPDKTETCSVSVKLEGHYQTIFVNPKDLTFVHHGFEVGDRVRGRYGRDGWRMSAVGHVRAVDGDYAWVEPESRGAHATVALRDLELAPTAAPLAAALENADADADISF